MKWAVLEAWPRSSQWHLCKTETNAEIEAARLRERYHGYPWRPVITVEKT